MYKSGVLFSALHSKGITLSTFLNIVDWFPNQVVFIDDILDNVRVVTEAMDKIGINCIGIHYTAAYSIPSAVNMEQAQGQINHFVLNGRWISDVDWSK